ncbi:hypothetical protein L288_14205 [Sphingobium quisquiliarum P25]|uniref:Pyridine nucleotide-disulfide oxidoreductase domain-containing protein 2 n=2 Tax=Sphingobium quisquiliarum TaxID=538379 RepID=T0GU90_9SPHN|nr:hypothetical protein L288_14205 [Sphingobium quisquiliarum P25]
MADYDIIFIGAGHNGLTAACYMAKAGKKVLLLEAKDHVGGGVVTTELTLPGYYHDEHSTAHQLILGNPMITQDELGLMSKFGLEYRYADVALAAIFIDQTSISVYKDLDRTCQSIAETCGDEDAEAYRAFAKASMAMLPMFVNGLYSPPLPMGAFMAMLDQSEEGRDLFNAMQRSTLDIVCQRFQSDKLRLLLARFITENLQMPDELGTGMGAVLWPGLVHTFGLAQPVGGSGKLTDAMVRALASFGAEIRCNAQVSRIHSSGGRATGVELADGGVITARDGVVAGLHPAVLRRFVEGVPEPVLQRGERVTQAAFSVQVSHYALKEPARFIAGGDAQKGVLLEMIDTVKLSELLDDFDQLRRGRMSARRLAGGGDMAINDPTRAPAGGGIFYGVQFAPYELEGHDASYWDEVKEAEADKTLAHYQKFISNLTSDNILKRVVHSPLDMERHSPNSFLRGDIHGCAPYFYQTMAHRPTADYGNIAVPGVEGLYLVGPFMHPGGGVFGGGRAAAIRMMDDLRMDFERLIG